MINGRGMAYREFTDDRGIAWQVWDTYPQKREFVSPGLRHGWLSFAADGEKCRLAPVPAGWAESTEVQLRVLLRAARRTAAKRE